MPLGERAPQTVDHLAVESHAPHQLENDEVQRQRRIDQTHVDHRPITLGTDGAPANQLDPPVDEALGRSQPLDVRGHRFAELRGYFLDPRNDAEPELVAQVFGRSVRRVLPIGNLVGQGIIDDLAARREKQRTDQPAVDHMDAGQPAQPGPANQVDEKGLDRVVGMVSDGDLVVPVLVAQLVEPTVAEPTGGHFDRIAGRRDLGQCIEASPEIGYSVTSRLLFDEHIVLVGLPAAELKIAMSHADAVAAAHEKREHHHRVDPSADGQQNPLVGRTERPLAHIAAELLL